MPKDEYIKPEDKNRYVKPLEPGHPNYDRRKLQAWLKVLGPKKLPPGSKNYYTWYLDWAWKKMQGEQLEETTLRYLKKVLALKWEEIDNYHKRKEKDVH